MAVPFHARERAMECATELGFPAGVRRRYCQSRRPEERKERNEMDLTNTVSNLTGQVTYLTGLVWPVGIGIAVALLVWGYVKIVAKRAK